MTHQFNTFGSRTVYKLRSNSPLTDNQIERVAPSVFAEAPHASRSDKYAFIRTLDVLHGLRKNGFEVFEVSQKRSLQAANRETTRHQLRLRHASRLDGSITKVGDVFPEIVLLNSHDGSSAYQLHSGFFRLACSNGLVVADSTADRISIRHTGDIVDDVIEGSFRVLDNLEIASDRIDTFSGIELDTREQHALAAAGAQIRWGDDWASKVAPARLLLAHRYADNKKDLWTVGNVIQENLIKGGTLIRGSTGKRSHSKAITGLDEDIKVNRALWTLFDELAKYKTGETTH